jgi:2-polyprenyl-3-methyl-5-hydroxy-6-metoxy-1,4-benzoquinol methylase
MDLQAEVDAYAQADFSQVNQRFVDHVLANAPADRALRVLDIGCGPADIPIMIALARPHWKITAVDASSPMLQVAAKKAAHELARNIRFRLADAKHLPSDLGEFELIISNSLLHHLPEVKDFWRSLKARAARGATVVLRDLARPASELDARLLVSSYAGGEPELLQEEYYRSLLAAFTVEEVRKQLDDAGLKKLGVQMVSDRHLDVSGTIA